LAFPLKSKSDPGLAVSRKNKIIAKDEFNNIWKACVVYFVVGNAPVLQCCTVSLNAVFRFLPCCYDRLCSEVWGGHWVGCVVGFLHHHYRCTASNGLTAVSDLDEMWTAVVVRWNVCYQLLCDGF
jgi:hypothetical protein